MILGDLDLRTYPQLGLHVGELLDHHHLLLDPEALVHQVNRSSIDMCNWELPMQHQRSLQQRHPRPVSDGVGICDVLDHSLRKLPTSVLVHHGGPELGPGLNDGNLW